VLASCALDYETDDCDENIQPAALRAA
jgi:hypothetical protein